MSKFTEQDIKDFVSLGFKTTDKLKKHKTPVQIKVNGQAIVLSSGKSIWNGIGNAKNALINHCSYFRRTFLQKHNSYYQKDLWNEFLDYLQERGILEFVELKGDEC